jgi:tetratricopeptide (TPR) repeat protein
MKAKGWWWVVVVLAVLMVPSLAFGQSATARLQESYELEAVGKTQDALGALERIEPSARSYVVHLRRGWLLYLLGRHGEAVAPYEQAIAAAPKAVEPRLGVMLPLMAERRWLDASVHAQKVLERDPGNYLASSRLAFSLYNLGRFGDALPHYLRMVEAYPSDVEMRNGVGWTLLKLGRGKESAQAFREVLQVSPKNASALEGLQALGVPS